MVGCCGSADCIVERTEHLLDLQIETPLTYIRESFEKLIEIFPNPRAFIDSLQEDQLLILVNDYDFRIYRKSVEELGRDLFLPFGHESAEGGGLSLMTITEAHDRIVGVLSLFDQSVIMYMREDGGLLGKDMLLSNWLDKLLG